MTRGAYLTIAILLLCAGSAAAVTEADRCEAAKLKTAGKYYVCLLKAEAKGVLTGTPVGPSLCDGKLVPKWTTAEVGGGGMCPTNGDLPAIQTQVQGDVSSIALNLDGVRFVDHGDGTVTDTATGLMWEQKDDLGGIHDKDDLYTWSATESAADGSAFTTFLATLNDGASSDGSTISGCFAGHCDWRLPTSAELQTILLAPAPCGASPCIDPAFGPTKLAEYWSVTSSTDAPPDGAWVVYFDNGSLAVDTKVFGSYVRAVRGGS